MTLLHGNFCTISWWGCSKHVWESNICSTLVSALLYSTSNYILLCFNSTWMYYQKLTHSVIWISSKWVCFQLLCGQNEGYVYFLRNRLIVVSIFRHVFPINGPFVQGVYWLLLVVMHKCTVIQSFGGFFVPSKDIFCTAVKMPVIV